MNKLFTGEMYIRTNKDIQRILNLSIADELIYMSFKDDILWFDYVTEWNDKIKLTIQTNKYCLGARLTDYIVNKNLPIDTLYKLMKEVQFTLTVCNIDCNFFDGTTYSKKLKNKDKILFITFISNYIDYIHVILKPEPKIYKPKLNVYSYSSVINVYHEDEKIMRLDLKDDNHVNNVVDKTFHETFLSVGTKIKNNLLPNNIIDGLNNMFSNYELTYVDQFDERIKLYESKDKVFWRIREAMLNDYIIIEMEYDYDTRDNFTFKLSNKQLKRCSKYIDKDYLSVLEYLRDQYIETIWYFNDVNKKCSYASACCVPLMHKDKHKLIEILIKKLRCKE